MAELNIPAYDFRSGILTRKLKSRPDLEMYKNGLEIGENFLTQLHGPAEFRSGTMFTKPIRGNAVPHFVTFAFNDDESYILCFTEGWLTFYANRGAVLETAQTPTAITQADPGVITIAGHGLVDGDEVFIDNVGGMEELNGRWFVVVYIDANTFSLQDYFGNDIDTTAFTAFTSGGEVSRVYAIASPYKEEHLDELSYAQKLDLMYLDHDRYAPRKLIRLGNTSWTLSTYTRTNDPFEQKVITAITQANPGRVTVNAHGYSNGDQVLIEDVSGMTEVNHEVFTVTVVDANNFTIGVDTSGYTAYTSGGIVALYGNYPATCAFYGGRLFHGGALNNPDILDGSRSPDPTSGLTRYEDHTLGSAEDNAVTLALTSASSTTQDSIRFFVGTRQFLGVGTFAGMLKVNGGSDADPISGTAIQSFPVDSFGVAKIVPLSFGTDVIYVQRGKETVFSFKYTILSDDYESTEESIQSDELLIGGIRQLAYQQGRPNRLWAAMEDGRLLTLVYNRKEEVSSWMEQLLGGSGICLTVATEPQTDNIDSVWVGVERTINGQTCRYAEFFEKNTAIPERDDYYSGTTAADKEADEEQYYNVLFEAQKRQVHLDCCSVLDKTQTTTITPGATTGEDVTFTAGASIFSSADVGKRIVVKYLTGLESGIARIIEYTSGTEVQCEILKDFLDTDPIASGGWYLTQATISGLYHLEGEEVYVVADGGEEGPYTVTDGAITLASQTTYAIVGKKYIGRLKGFPLELLMTSGITPGKMKTINKIMFIFRNALGVSYGFDPYALSRLGFRDGGQYAGRPPRLFNGAREVPGFDMWNEQRQMNIVQTASYPCTVQSVIYDTEVVLEG